MLRMVLVWMVVIGACSKSDDAGSSGPGDGGAGSGHGAGSGNMNSPGDAGGSDAHGLALGIDAAHALAKVGSAGAPAGEFFLVVDVTLANTGASVALPASPAWFSVATTDALTYAASAARPANACDPAVSIEPGGALACSLAFALPTGATPTLLRYDDQHGDHADAAVPALALAGAACLAVEAWATSNNATCLMCVVGSIQQGGACEAGAHTYAQSCHSCTCDDLATECSCEASCDAEPCQELYASYMQCIASTCAAVCP